MKIGIVGAGITGLTAAYYLSKRGHQVVIFEKEAYPGGLAAGFKEPGWEWPLDNFFHHLFTSDREAKSLISELGLEKKLFYRRPKTSIYFKGKISQFDSPFSILTFPHLSLPEKLRTGLVAAYLKLKTPRMVAGWSEAEAMTPPRWKDWEFDKIPASAWLKKHFGQKPYQILWQPLLEGKFSNYAKDISMSWFWARIKKRSAALGYLEGGFQALIGELSRRIKKNGGKFYLKTEIARVTSDGGRLSLRSHDSSEVDSFDNKFDRVLFATPPLPFLPINKELPEMRGALNLILVLKKPFLTDGTYWLNINEKGFPFVAVVEHTNFIAPKYYGGNHILYVGGYYPQNHKFFKMTKEKIFDTFQPYLQKINPHFNFSLHTTYYILHTSKFAQPVILTHYSKIIPSLRTNLPNVFWASMYHIYPWDRGVNYAIELGEKAANEMLK